jgi:hypothetical protein
MTDGTMRDALDDIIRGLDLTSADQVRGADKLRQAILAAHSEPGAEGLNVRWQKSLLRYYADTMPGYAAAAGLSRDEYAAVMVDVKRARDEYAALAETETKPNE